MAFGGLKQSDVKVVEFSSYGAMWKGLLNNDTDAAFATTITGPAKEAETSPRGLIWPPLPHSDNAGWERVQKVGSFFFRHVATCGAGISKEKPIELGNYPYPIFVAYGSQPAEQVYAITKAMITGYDVYKDAAAGAATVLPVVFLPSSPRMARRGSSTNPKRKRGPTSLTLRVSKRGP